MDEKLRRLLSLYIEREVRGLEPDVEDLCGGDESLLRALRKAVGDYHAVQQILGRPEDRRTAATPLSASPDDRSRIVRREELSPGIGRRLGLWGRAGGAFWLLLTVFSLSGLYVLARLTWADGHFRPAIELTDDLALARSLTSRGNTYGLDPGFRITQVFGERVVSREELFAAIDRHSDRSVRLRVETREGEAESERSREVLWVEHTHFTPPRVDRDLLLLPADPLVEEGVTARSRIVAVDGTAVSSKAEIDRLSGPRMGRAMRFAFDADSPESVDLAVVTLVNWSVHYTLFLVGLAFGVLGLATLWLKPRSRSSLGFLLFCFVIAGFWFVRAIPHHYRLGLERQTYLLLQCLLPLGSVALLGTFTPLRLRMVPLTPYLWGASALGALFLLGSTVLSPQQARVGLLADALLIPGLLVALFLVLAAQVSDLGPRLRRLELGVTDRQRARVIRWATLLGFAPYVLMASSAIGGSREARIWIELSVLAFPLLLAYAIQQHNLLQINGLLREAFLLALILATIRLVYAGIAAVAGPVASRALPFSSAGLQAVFLGGTILLLAPLHGRIRRAVLHRFRNPPGGWEELSRTLDRCRNEAASAQQLARTLVETVERELQATNVSLLLESPEDGAWRLAATTLRADSWVGLDECRPLLEVLEERAMPLLLDDLLDDLRYRRVRQSCLSGMSALSASIVYPLFVDGKLLGALALGDRSASNYTADHLKLASRTADRIGRDLSAAIEADRRRRGIAALYPDFPKRIGEYEIERVLGAGAMAYVYLGRRRDEPVAIKVPTRQVQLDGRLLERFLRERSLQKMLKHPNIVPVFDTGWALGEPYLCMEYFPRGSLDCYIESRGRLDEAQALTIAREIGVALAGALQRKVIHRDLKPRNVFMTAPDSVKVGDFGLARLLDAPTLTSEGRVFGTPAYLSPEVARGGRADWRSDQYALGVMVFEMLVGERPFRATSFEGLLYQHLTAPVPSLRARRPDLSESTEVAVRRMMAKSPDDRYSSYEELLEGITGPEMVLEHS